MTATNQLIVEGNLVADPELRFGQNGGTPFVNLRIAHNHYQGQDNDDVVSFFNVVAFKGTAENVSESLKKGDRIVVVGRVHVRPWEDEDKGTSGTSVDVIADSISASLRFSTAELTKATSGSNVPVSSRAGGPAVNGEAADMGEPF